jgi:enoyl-CoA hydratase
MLAAKEDAMSHECFEVSMEGKVAHLRLSRPERRNAMTAGFWVELPAIVRELDAGGGVRALVLSSTGPHFCAGLDLAMFQSSGALGGATPEARLRFRRELERLQASLDSLAAAISVIAAIQAAASGVVDMATPAARYATRRLFRDQRSTSA